MCSAESPVIQWDWVLNEFGRIKGENLNYRAVVRKSSQWTSKFMVLV